MSLTIFNQGSLPVLERLVQFTEARQKLIAHNIANVSNPYFKPVDVDPKSFQRVMARAVDQRRSSSAPRSTPLDLPAPNGQRTGSGKARDRAACRAMTGPGGPAPTRLR